MSNRYFDTDMVSRVSTGKAASEEYRHERRARLWNAVGLIAAVVAVLFMALIVDRAAAQTKTVERPTQIPGPVCPTYGTKFHSCL